MPSIDWPLDQLRDYRPETSREPDFDDYWQMTMAEALAQPLRAELTPCGLPARDLECFSVRFDGYGGSRIAGWYLRPPGSGPFPAVCVYHGYSGRGPRLLDLLPLAYQGIAVLSMDCRGQNGESQDTASYPEGRSPGWMTQGIREKWSYYYRYVYADAVRALELLAQREEVDEKRLAVTGVSQGGGLTLAAAALSQLPILALPDIPFLADFRRAIRIATAGPYLEIPNFLKAHPYTEDAVFRTLSYCDTLNLAGRIQCRTVMLNCLWDDICPPSTVFGVYNQIRAEKRIEVYPYHKHEVPYEHNELKFRLLVETLRP
jgi:cephalosporin-C deacetylase